MELEELKERLAAVKRWNYKSGTDDELSEDYASLNDLKKMLHQLIDEVEDWQWSGFEFRFGELPVDDHSIAIGATGVGGFNEGYDDKGDDDYFFEVTAYKPVD